MFKRPSLFHLVIQKDNCYVARFVGFEPLQHYFVMLPLVNTRTVSLSYRSDDAELQRMTGSKAIQPPPSQEK